MFKQTPFEHLGVQTIYLESIVRFTARAAAANGCTAAHGTRADARTQARVAGAVVGGTKPLILLLKHPNGCCREIMLSHARMSQ